MAALLITLLKQLPERVIAFPLKQKLPMATVPL
jgi:hypothetical protein